MASGIERIRDTMWKGPQPAIARTAAFLLTLSVVAVDRVLGGTWWAVLVSILLFALACFIFPTATPSSERYRAILETVRKLRETSLPARLICATAMIAAAFVLDYYLDRSPVGRAFNLFLTPVFFAALLFGIPVAIAAWLVSCVVVYFSVIPPRFSFELDSLKDFASLMGYFYLGLLALAVPALIRSSSSTSDAD